MFYLAISPGRRLVRPSYRKWLRHHFINLAKLPFRWVEAAGDLGEKKLGNGSSYKW